MIKFRNVMAGIAALLIILTLYFLDWNDLSWSNNFGNYLGIISMLLLIMAMVLSNRHETRTRRKT